MGRSVVAGQMSVLWMHININAVTAGLIQILTKRTARLTARIGAVMVKTDAAVAQAITAKWA